MGTVRFIAPVESLHVPYHAKGLPGKFPLPRFRPGRATRGVSGGYKGVFMGARAIRGVHGVGGYEGAISVRGGGFKGEQPYVDWESCCIRADNPPQFLPSQSDETLNPKP